MVVGPVKLNVARPLFKTYIAKAAPFRINTLKELLLLSHPRTAEEVLNGPLNEM
jgi:hypothetical protein